MRSRALSQRNVALVKAHTRTRRPLADKTAAVLNRGGPSSGTRLSMQKSEVLKEELRVKEQKLTETERINTSLAETNDELQAAMEQLRMEVNSLQMDVKAGTVSLAHVSNTLQRFRKHARGRSVSLYNARRVARHEVLVAATLRREVRNVNNELQDKKMELMEKTHEAFAAENRAELYLRSLAENHARTAEFWNRLQVSGHQQTILLNRISTLTSYISRLERGYRDLQRLNNRRRARLAHTERRMCTQESLKAAIYKFMKLTDKGVYTTHIRSLVLQLLRFGCPTSNIGHIIDSFLHAITRAVGIPRSGKKQRRISTRTVGRIVGEADVAGHIQLGYELKRTPSLTAGGDGTSNKNQTFEAMSVNLVAEETYLNEDGGLASGPKEEHKVQFIKVDLAANHRAETQKNATIEAIREAVEMFNRSPLAAADDVPGGLFDESSIAMKLVGSHGDHAEDQKAKNRLLGEWKRELSMRGLGAQYLYSRSEDERNILIASSNATMIARNGGERAWAQLDNKEKIKQNNDAFHELCESLADEAYLHLSDVEKRRLTLWVWSGCGMHKDLNSVKGGNTAMQAKWKDLDDSPIGLANKDNTAVLDLADDEYEDGDEEEVRHEEGPAARRAREVTQAGGVKLASLVGALLNHKDDKKGQHDTFRDYVIFSKGRTMTFPDTSNTRYSSYLEAAAEIVGHLDFYLEYMHYIQDSKEKRTLNNLEANVLKGLQDGPTLTELAVLALYQEAVSFSYITMIRGPGLQKTNALDLGPLHEKVRTHIKKLINDPSIILSVRADPKEATMNGFSTWKDPEAVQAIHERAAVLPHLQDAFKAFMTGALATWERFSAEFADDGTIAALTEAERDLAWMPATNDGNEGALGAYRLFARKNPSGTMKLFNSIFRLRRNGTQDFMDAFLTGDNNEAFLRREARSQDSKGLERKRRRDIHNELIEAVLSKRRKDGIRNEKREVRRREIESVEIQTDRDKVMRMTVPQLKDQLDKLRNIDKQIPLETKMKRKEAKKSELMKALDRYQVRNSRDVEMVDMCNSE